MFPFFDHLTGTLDMRKTDIGDINKIARITWFRIRRPSLRFWNFPKPTILCTIFEMVPMVAFPDFRVNKEANYLMTILLHPGSRILITVSIFQCYFESFYKYTCISDFGEHHFVDLFWFIWEVVFYTSLYTDLRDNWHNAKRGPGSHTDDTVWHPGGCISGPWSDTLD